MVEVMFVMPEPCSNGTYKLTVTGHAGAEEPGKFDEVCAAVSTLVYTLAQNIKDAKDLGWLRKNPTLKLNEGDASIKAKPVQEKETLVATMFTVITRGLQMIAFNYPDFVKFTKVLPDIGPTT